MGAGEVAYIVPGIGIREATDPLAETVNHIDPAQDVVHPPGAIQIPYGAEAEVAPRIMPRGHAGSAIVPVILGDQVLARKIVTQRPDDLGNGAGIDGLHRVEAETIHAIISSVHAGIIT